MAHYPLISGNNHANSGSGVAASTYDLDNDSTEEIFDVYTFQNSTNDAQAAYAVIVVKNTGSAGSQLSISDVRLTDGSTFVGVDDSAYNSFTMNPLNNSGKIFIGRPEHQASGANFLSNATAEPKLGPSSDAVAHVANMFLNLTANANIDETVLNNPQLGTIGRTIPIYKLAGGLLTNPIPADSYGAFIIQYKPTTVQAQNSGTYVQISSNVGSHTINLQKEAFNTVILNAKLGALVGSTWSTVATAVDTGSLDLGYYGRAKTVSKLSDLVGGTRLHVQISDESSEAGADFTWVTAAASGSNGVLNIGGDTALTVPSTLSYANIAGNFIDGNNTGWFTQSNLQDFEDVIDGNYVLSSANGYSGDPASSNQNIYKNVGFGGYGTGFYLGTRGMITPSTQATGENYSLDDFAFGQYLGVSFSSDSYAYTTAQKNFMFLIKGGIYERMTIPSSQMNKTVGYNVKSAGSGITPPQLDSEGVGALNGSIVNLIINVRWNNWARAASGEDNGSEITFTPGGGSSVFRLNNTNHVQGTVTPSKYAIASTNDGTENYNTTVFNSFNFSAQDTKDVALFYPCPLELKYATIWGSFGNITNSKLDDDYLLPWGVASSTYYASTNDTVGWNPEGNYPHMPISDNFYTIKHQLRPSYPDLLPKSSGESTAFPSGIYTQLSNLPNTSADTTSVMDGTIAKLAVANWYTAYNSVINNTTGSFPLSTSMGVRTMYSGHRGGVYTNENSSLQVAGTATTSGFESLVDTIGRGTNSINATTGLSYAESHIQTCFLTSGSPGVLHTVPDNTYLTVGMDFYRDNEDGTYLGKVTSLVSTNKFVSDTAVVGAQIGPNKVLLFKGNKSYNSYTPYIKNANNSQRRDFVPNNNIYKMLDSVLADDGSGDFVTFGRVILSNPGDSILYLHSIETGTNSGMYDYDITGVTNNGTADLGYKPNSSAEDPILSISIQGKDANIHGEGGTPSFATKYSFYTQNALATATVGDATRWYSTNPTTYYKNLGRNQSVAVHSEIIANVNASEVLPIPTYENLSKDCQAGWSFSFAGYTPESNSTYIERLSSDAALTTDTLTTSTGLTLSGGARVNPTLDIKMSIPIATVVADSYGGYQSWMRIVFMPADYYNHKYYNTTNSAFESLESTTYDANGIRLYESIYLFKTDVANNAAIVTADVEGDGVGSGETIDFGIISIG